MLPGFAQPGPRQVARRGYSASLSVGLSKTSSKRTFPCSKSNFPTCFGDFKFKVEIYAQDQDQEKYKCQSLEILIRSMNGIYSIRRLEDLESRAQIECSKIN